MKSWSVNNNPPASVREAMLLAFAGMFPFTTNPPHHLGEEGSRVRGFWLCAPGGKVTKVSRQVWLEKFPPRDRCKRPREERAGRQGGRIVIGLAEGEVEESLKLIEVRVPDLLSGALVQELTDSGWIVGRFGFGRYVAEDGTLFDNRAVVAQIVGIGSATLQEVARRMAEGLGQASVLVFDDGTDEMYLMGPKR